MKVLHVLETSIPNTVGYTVRAREIVNHQRRAGLDPVVVTSPFFQTDSPETQVEEIEGVRYYRTNFIARPSAQQSRLVSLAARVAMILRYRRAIARISAIEKPDVIHAHSSYTNVYGALPAARELRVPLIYEVRTLWGESAVVEDGLRTNSLKHRIVWALELGAMRRADLIVPIAEGIRAELVERGIPDRKLTVVPNGVDLARFVPRPPDQARAQSLGMNDRFVVGFIGTIRKLEGLTTLVEAFSIVNKTRPATGLVVVGDGPDRKNLEEASRKLGLENAIFPGSVPHADVDSWYSILDLVVYPRLRATINNRVTPLKPLEAMALGKVCIGSDVGGLTELIDNDKTGVIFPSGDAEALARTIISLMDDRDRMARLREHAFLYVRRERSWSAIVERYVSLYERLTANGRHAAAADA